MLAEFPIEQFVKAAENVTAGLLHNVGWTEPPVDTLAVARRLHMVVAEAPIGAPRAQLVRLGPRRCATILLASEPRAERRQWAVAHEIGEACAHRVCTAVGAEPVDLPGSMREAIAHQLARSLLLPRRWMLDIGAAVDWDLLQMKAHFSTASHEVIARRMLDLPPGVVITVCDEGRVTWRRSNVARRPPPLAPPEVDALRFVRSEGVAVRCEHAALPAEVVDVRAWPVYEPSWRREIVRTELAE